MAAIFTTQITGASNTANYVNVGNVGITPGYIWAGFPGTQDPLSYNPLPQAPRSHAETNEEWLRRRVREVQWKPA